MIIDITTDTKITLADKRPLSNDLNTYLPHDFRGATREQYLACLQKIVDKYSIDFTEYYSVAIHWVSVLGSSTNTTNINCTMMFTEGTDLYLYTDDDANFWYGSYTNFNSKTDVKQCYYYYQRNNNPNTPSDNIRMDFRVTPKFGSDKPVIGEWVNMSSDDVSYTIIVGLEDSQEPPDDIPGGASSTGGGNGSFDNTSDPVAIPNIVVDTQATGFYTVYTPSPQQILDLSERLLQPDAIDVIKNLWANPLDSIISLSLVPFTIESDESANILVGWFDTTINAPFASKQIQTFNCGNITVEEYWGSFLDYAPYTTIELYLPFIGVVPLPTDLVMGDTINIEYKLDLLTGSCMAYVYNVSKQQVIKIETGQYDIPIPLSSVDYSENLKALATFAAATATAAVGGVLPVLKSAVGASTVASTAVGASTVASTGKSSQSFVNLKKTSVDLSKSEPVDIPIPNINLSGVTGILQKPAITKSGALSGGLSLMAIKTPFLVIHRPIQSYPAGYEHYAGRPSNITAKLADLSGFTSVKYLYLDNIKNATQRELELIRALLMGGVIL